MTPSDPLTFIVLNPAGLLVNGQHQNTSPSPPSLLVEDIAQRRANWRTTVLSRPEGFDGARAVLEDFCYHRGTLSLRTRYRSYTEGLALRDSLAQARADGEFVLPTSSIMQPRADISWGMSLTSYVLLPGGYALCGERDASLFSLPGAWTCSHTEIMEPTDIDSVAMQPLIARLVAEELPALAGLGIHKFVGLSLRKNSYLWQLVALIDLRLVEPETVRAALLALEPDAETAAWSVVPLEDAVGLNTYHEALYRPAGTLPDDFDIANFLHRAVAPC